MPLLPLLPLLLVVVVLPLLPLLVVVVVLLLLLLHYCCWLILLSCESYMKDVTPNAQKLSGYEYE